MFLVPAHLSYPGLKGCKTVVVVVNDYFWLFSVQEHCCILYSILGWNTIVGPWTRIEGTPFDPNPNKPFAKLELEDLFLPNGRLSPSITIIGKELLHYVSCRLFSAVDLIHARKNSSRQIMFPICTLNS